MVLENLFLYFCNFNGVKEFVKWGICMYIIYIMELNVLVEQKRGMKYHYCDEFFCMASVA